MFITNILIALNYDFVVAAYGDGPMRLIDAGTAWQVAVVNDSAIIATLFQIDKTALVGDETTPLYKIVDSR